jgi:hypothetical protein
MDLATERNKIGGLGYKKIKIKKCLEKNRKPTRLASLGLAPFRTRNAAPQSPTLRKRKRARGAFFSSYMTYIA